MKLYLFADDPNLIYTDKISNQIVACVASVPVGVELNRSARSGMLGTEATNDEL